MWERVEAMSVIISLIIAGVLAAIPTLAMRFHLSGFLAEQSLGIGLALWFFLLVFMVTPMRMAIEKVKLTTKGLRVVGSESYNCGGGYNWLRLMVENPTGVPIPNCYGKLCGRKMVATNLIKIDERETRLFVSPERGRESEPSAQLPPEGHKFPWSPTSVADTTITIPGFNSREYLYYAAKLKSSGAFGFPSEIGIKYNNFSLGDFELEIEVGSESETFKPTKVCVTFRAEGGDLKFLIMKNVN